MFRCLSWVCTVGALVLVAGGVFYVLYPDGIAEPDQALIVEESTQDLGLMTVGAEREIVFRFVNQADGPRAVVGTKGI